MRGGDCTCNPTAMKPDTECPAHAADLFAEMFPGTLAALDALTIRKATTCESKK